MRIFVGLDIDEAIRERISRFMDGVREFAPEARWVGPESLHLTLKFIGEQPEAAVEQISRALSQVRGSAVQAAFRGYGFFPTAKSARVFWIGIEAGPELSSVARSVDQATASLGIPKEERPFSPHLTLARGGDGSGSPRRQKGDRPNRSFQRLQEKLAVLSQTEFGAMTAREFFLYRSELQRGGSRYTKIARFAFTEP
jgi:2'-5' RNA ligase